MTQSPLARAARASEEFTLSKPHFIDLAEWASKEPPERRWLVPGLIPYGCVTALYGDGGAGKTQLALSLMVAMASKYAAKWLDEDPRGWKSVGLFAEDDKLELIRRLRRISDGLGVAWGAVASSVSVVAGVGHDTVIADYRGIGLANTPVMETLLTKVRETGAALLVIDCAAAVFGGSEIDRLQVSDFMLHLNAVAAEHDIAILLLGHPSVDGMKGRGTSGSTAWRNHSRSFLQLTAEDTLGEPEGRRVLKITLSKANYARTGRTYTLATDGSRFDVLEVADNVKARARRQRVPPSQDTALKALECAVVETGSVREGVKGASISCWREKAYSMGISPSQTEGARKRAFDRARNLLVERRLVHMRDGFASLTEEPGQ